MSKEFNMDANSTESIEAFVNNELVMNENVIGYYVKNSYNQTFMAHDMLSMEDVGFDVNEIEDIPTNVILGNYDDPAKFISMTFFTYDYELEEDEPLEVTAEKFKKHIYRLRNILIDDFDFCLISYPVLAETDDFTKDSIFKYGLESIIFNKKGFIGGALSKRTEVRTRKERGSDIHIQYLLPEKNLNISYKEAKQFTGNKDEARTYSRIVENFYDLPSMPSEESLNSFIDELNKDRMKVITTSKAFKEEFRNKIANLPLDGFVLLDDETRNKETMQEIMTAVIANAKIEPEEADQLMEMINTYFVEEEE